MTKYEAFWSASEPELGGQIDTLRIPIIGHAQLKRDMVDTRFPYHGVGLVLEGDGFFQIDDGPMHPVEAPAVFYVSAGPRFRYGPHPGAAWEERYLCFAGPRVADWQRWRWLPDAGAPRGLLSVSEHVGHHRRAVQAFQRGGVGDLDEAKLAAEQLVFSLHREAELGKSRRDPLSRLLSEWREALPRDVDLRKCAARLEMSYSGFRQQFRECTGLSVYQYLLRLRLDAACQLLIASDQQVKAIAHASGFSGVESFCRAFQRLKRMTATEYRSRHRAMRNAPIIG